MTTSPQSPTTNPVLFRTYSRRSSGRRESWPEICDRVVTGLTKLGSFTDEESALVRSQLEQWRSFPSGRWLWVGGTPWVEKPENFPGAYNCSSTDITDWDAFGLMMDLAMQGCGTGAVLEPRCIEQLPPICNQLEVKVSTEIGEKPANGRIQETRIHRLDRYYDQHYRKLIKYQITVGDSREGWVKAYQSILEFASKSCGFENEKIYIFVDLSNVRPAGEVLQGFGGIANPVKLPTLYERCANILNKAVGRQLTSLECCLLIDEAANCVVAGNIRRCLPENTLIHTIRGLVPIKDIQVGELVQTPMGFRKVANKFYQGKQNVYELKTNSFSPRATANHRFAIFESPKGAFRWKKVSELQPGDRLVHTREVLLGEKTRLPDDFTKERPANSRTAKNIIIPKLDTDVSWLIGFTHGNGYVALGRNKHGKPFGRVEWSFNSSQRDLMAAIRGRIDSVLAKFELTATFSIAKDENTAKIICSSIRLAEYFFRYIKQAKQPLDIPDFILQGTSHIRGAYLAGLADSDGGIHNKPPIAVTTIYQDFKRQVGAIYSSLGIAGRISVTTTTEKTWNQKYNVTMPALKEKYNLRVAPYSLKGFLTCGLKMNGFTFTGEMMRSVYSYSELRGFGFQGSEKINSNYERYIAESGCDVDIPVTFERIESVDYVETYDIEVEEAHCFYADGYLTHNSAGMRQFHSDDPLGATAKDNLWQQDAEGNWRIDPERDALRMANHTRVFHRKPTLEECIDSVRKQYYSGEGAIQYAPEAIARANADILNTPSIKAEFLRRYVSDPCDAETWLQSDDLSNKEVAHRLNRYGLNPCGEIILNNNFCNLAEIHLNRIDPSDWEAQEQAFRAGALSVAALLNHQFTEKRYQYSRTIDPIVGVSITGLFDFFVQAFGVDWLRWWEAGRPNDWEWIGDASPNYCYDEHDGASYKSEFFQTEEKKYLSRWRRIVEEAVWDYCDRNGLKRPNRCTTVQPAGTKSLLTGASSGWHPPKAQRFIRRITFGKNDPVALACIDYGYNVVPSESSKDENGNLLDDPFDPRVAEWMVEIPVEVSWANLPGADAIAIEKFSALAQFDFYMQVQQHYVTHNGSATIELREDEIEPLATAICEAIQDDKGYISAALLARFDAPFPRLPFEKIDKATYEQLTADVLQRRKSDDFHALLSAYDAGYSKTEGPAGCDSDKCMLPLQEPKA